MTVWANIFAQVIKKAPGPTADIVKILKDTNTDVVVNYLPVGSEMATKWYVEQILEAGCGFVNCIPVFIASQPILAEALYREAGLPIIGDDIKCQVGATITAPRPDHACSAIAACTWTAPTSSTSAATPTFSTCSSASVWNPRRFPRPAPSPPCLPYEMDPDDIHVGPSDYVPWLTDRKWCYIRMEGTTFGECAAQPGM